MHLGRCALRPRAAVAIVIDVGFIQTLRKGRSAPTQIPVTPIRPFELMAGKMKRFFVGGLALVTAITGLAPDALPRQPGGDAAGSLAGSAERACLGLAVSTV